MAMSSTSARLLEKIKTAIRTWETQQRIEESWKQYEIMMNQSKALAAEKKAREARIFHTVAIPEPLLLRHQGCSTRPKTEVAIVDNKLRDEIKKLQCTIGNRDVEVNELRARLSAIRQQWSSCSKRVADLRQCNASQSKTIGKYQKKDKSQKTEIEELKSALEFAQECNVEKTKEIKVRSDDQIELGRKVGRYKRFWKLSNHEIQQRVNEVRGLRNEVELLKKRLSLSKEKHLTCFEALCEALWRK